ncbi:glycosyltransferase involved in cell wall biosynthesis [Novosphingobium sp. PhB165]|uniref:glycosyltransferase family 4 protein n=1 Tax=Novosphingobium sp. PhB165 TaxID=2485105 RepID=UPI0010DCCCFD|nr:glycosyltransferase family 4 protein [Novosphingobium sp. PhB165]TCM21370.1 glycosyltransferase involved in cell wall biosynthesis [Novosphingobium sp. PhB165]
MKAIDAGQTRQEDIAPLVAVRPHRPTVCYPLAGDALGGSHVSLRGLLDGLDPSQVEVLVVPEVPDGRLAAFFSGIAQCPDPARPTNPFIPGRSIGIAKVLGTLTGLPKRVRFLKERGVDIVHTNDGRSHASWALAARIAGARLVWHHRGDPGARGLRYVAPVLADRIVAVSAFALPRGRRGAARTARVIHSPFDVSITADREAMRARILSETGSPADTVICGYFGSFVDRKRPLGFVEAVEALGRIVNRPVLGVMFGEPRETELDRRLDERIARVEAPARVMRMGYRSPGHAWLAGCDQLLVPAVDEPLGRTLVEAMLVGTLVVATDSGGNPEALRHGCGVLCPPDSPRAMALAAAGLLADPAWADTMRRDARTAARGRFSQARHVDAIRQIYEELI